MSKLSSVVGLSLSLWFCGAYAKQPVSISGPQAQVLFSIADDLYSTFPDDYVRDNPNETSYQYNCKFNISGGQYQPVYCEGPGGRITGRRMTSLAALGLQQKFKLTHDPGFDNGSAKGMGFYFEAKCFKIPEGAKSSYSCTLQDLQDKNE